MNHSLIIGLTGKAEHGKSATARIIREWVQNQSGVCEIVEISKIIYDLLVEEGKLPAGLTRDQLSNEQVKMLVEKGHELGEKDRRYWIRKTLSRVNPNADVVIIPNIRRPEEGDALRERGGIIWRLIRLNKDGSQFVSTTRDPNHPLETLMDHWSADFYLINQTGHGALLEQQVVTLYEYVVGLEE